jgi:hypothetical protein
MLQEPVLVLVSVEFDRSIAGQLIDYSIGRL